MNNSSWAKLQATNKFLRIEFPLGIFIHSNLAFCATEQELLKLWTEFYSDLIPNGGLELVFLLLWYK